jgi:hypothetical protein
MSITVKSTHAWTIVAAGSECPSGEFLNHVNQL